MRYLHIIDKEAPKWVEEICDDITKFYEPTGIKVEHEFDYRELKSIPKEIYWGDYEGISKFYIEMITAGVKAQYGNKIDRVNIWITDENWHLNGVWGWNLGIRYNGYDVHQTRIETRSSRKLITQKANTFGTLYHEGMHANGHTAKRGLKNFTVERLVNNNLDLSEPITDWQEDIVHGRHPDFDYIRFDHNQDALEAISTALSYQSSKQRLDSGDRSGISGFIQEALEQIEKILWKLENREEVIKPLTLEEQEILTKEYKKVIKK